MTPTPAPQPAPEPAPAPITSLVVRAQGVAVTLGARQLDVARAIITGAHSRGLGDEGARIGLITALVESKLRMYANSNVPESLGYPHDAVGSDFDSLNFFQQRVTWWATGTTAERVAKLMSQDYAISEFYRRFTYESLRNWRSMPPGAVAQRIQGSAYPDRYQQWLNAADTILEAI